MNSQSTPQIILTHFQWSLARLKEAIDKENTEYYRGAALHRFKITYTLGLQAIRAYAKAQGQICVTEISCFHWVKKKKWLEKTVDENNILADYEKVQNQPKGKEAKMIYEALPKYYAFLNHLSQHMQSINE